MSKSQAEQRRSAKPFDAGDAESVSQRNSLLAPFEQQRRAGLDLIMKSQDGRAWMHDLLSNCGVYRSSFTGNSDTFFLEGERNVGLRIMDDVMRDHEETYLMMLREAKARRLAVTTK